MKKSILALVVVGLISSVASAQPTSGADGTQRLVLALAATGIVATAIQRLLPVGQLNKHAISASVGLAGMGAALRNPTLVVVGIKTAVATSATAIANLPAVANILPNVPLVGDALAKAGNVGVALVTCAIYGSCTHAFAVQMGEMGARVAGI
ncbi:MAG: hypothetical protein V4534_05690 [Myxococcota bacterium]